MFSWIRRRPRWVKTIAIVVLLFVSWAGWIVWGVVWQQPNPAVDYIAEINELVRSSQPEGENAWPIYRDLIVNDLGYDGVTTFGNEKWAALKEAAGVLVLGQWSDARLDEPKALLESCAPLLATLDEAADKPVFYKPLVNNGSALVPKPSSGPHTLLITALLPELSPLRRLAVLNTAAMRAAAEAGDWRGVIRRFRTGLAMGEQLTRQADLMDHILGLGMMASAQVELANELNELDLPMEVCEALMVELARLPWSRAHSAARGFEGEVRVLRDIVQWVYTDDGHGDGVQQGDRFGIFSNGVPILANGWPHPTNLYSFLFEPSRRETMAMIDHWRQTMLDMIDMSPADFDRAEGEFYNSYAENLVLERFMPSITGAMKNYASFESHLAGTHVMLLLEMHHESTGGWPTSLTDAMNEADAKDPVSGELFEYELTPDDPTGRAYELRVPWGERDNPNAIINRPREPLTADLLGDGSGEE